MKITSPFLNALTEVETPALLIEEAVLLRNIRRLSQIAATAGVTWRPHVKTHKSLWLAGLQQAAGATGITTAKASEAIVFLGGGFRDVTVAYPLLDPTKIAQLLVTGRHAGAKLTLVVDSAEAVVLLAKEAERAEQTVSVFLEIDVGLRRCGLAPSAPGVAQLINSIAQHPSLRFAGLFSHAGHAYRCDGPVAVCEVAEAERRLLIALRQELQSLGIEVPYLSVGSTPTVLLAKNFDGLSEIRPGNAVFNDMTQVVLGAASRADIALSVIATVVSANDQYSIVDAGSKVLSSDQGPHGSQALTGFGCAVPLDDPSRDLSLVSLSEEHGFVATDSRPLPLGSRVRIWPNHACPVVNLADRMEVVSADGAIRQQPVDARGCVR